MTFTSDGGLRIVMYEGTDSRPLSEDGRFDILRALMENGYAVTRTTGVGTVTPADDHPLLVLGCFGRPDAPLEVEAEVPVLFQDIEDLSVEEVLEAVRKTADDLNLPTPGGWKPWFPVIDYERCTNCMQCLSFCLFDVYGVSPEQKLQVQNPQNCKTDCPACSRVCPEVAIVFPKYRSGPINGDEVNEGDVKREKMKIDISSLLGGDIYKTLRDRSQKAKSRFEKERDDNRALRERRRCLKALQAGGEVPEEMLMSLPDTDEIQAKAAAALAKTEEGSE